MSPSFVKNHNVIIKNKESVVNMNKKSVKNSLKDEKSTMPNVACG